MSEFAEKFRSRTKQFAVDVIKFSRTLPKSDEAYIVKKQLIRSSTSVAANYRATGRARSDAEFFSKLSIVVEEADESVFWLEIIEDADILKSDVTASLKNEAMEILKVVSKSRRTMKERKDAEKALAK